VLILRNEMTVVKIQFPPEDGKVLLCIINLKNVKLKKGKISRLILSQNIFSLEILDNAISSWRI